MEHPLDTAVRASELGSLAALARHLGVTPAAAKQWKEEGRVVPAEHCPKIEKLAQGVVRCEQLNHKVDWAYLRSTELAEQQ